ncbi:hypothetical protein M413DRAFT_23189 [Hebeloma cylindrosporum]|uniref:Uncharacterized protein n=1 Tax=Hebeloma cylindrosporum TaxID=76867 RepID=A0A0C2Z109_HEBCY|nr:hypothetical protein M413DRAFT_23189 [Hebeloma cylindrosporum h7]
MYPKKDSKGGIGNAIVSGVGQFANALTGPTNPSAPPPSAPPPAQPAFVPKGRITVKVKGRPGGGSQQPPPPPPPP